MCPTNLDLRALRGVWLASASIAAALSASCNPTPASGQFDAQRLELRGCDEELLPWEPGFYTIDQFENRTTIRLQSIGGGIGQIDGIFIQVENSLVDPTNPDGMPLGDPALRAALIEQGVSVPPPIEGEPVGGAARAVLGFYESCPEARDVPEIIGRLRFTRFDPTNGGQITGFVTAPVVVDTRTGDIVGEVLSGRFSFVVQKGRPYTNFTGPGNQAP